MNLISNFNENPIELNNSATINVRIQVRANANAHAHSKLEICSGGINTSAHEERESGSVRWDMSEIVRRAIRSVDVNAS